MLNIPSSKKVQRAWAMYDWANSAYNLVITSTIFPAYYVAITSDKLAETTDYVDFFGWKVANSVLLEYSLALAYFVIALLSPILSSIADYKGNKKRVHAIILLYRRTVPVWPYSFLNRGKWSWALSALCWQQ